MKQCPKCDKMLPDNALSCSRCRFEFPSSDTWVDSEHVILYKEAISSFSKGRYNEAMDYALGALALDSENSEYNNFRLQIINKQQDKQRSKELFEAATLAFRNNNLVIARSLLNDALTLFPGKKYLQLKQEIEIAEQNAGYGETQLLDNVNRLRESGELKEAVALLHETRIEHPSWGNEFWKEITEQLVAETKARVLRMIKDREYDQAKIELLDLKVILPHCPELPILKKKIMKTRKRRRRNRVIMILFILLLITAAAGVFWYLDVQKTASREMWENVKETNTIPEYRSFILQNSQSEFLDLANKALSRLLEGEKVAWDKVTTQHTPQAYDEYLTRFPGGTFQVEATHLLDSLSWIEAMTANTPESFVAYLERFPSGEMVEDARYFKDHLEAKIPSREDALRVDSIFTRYFSCIEKQEFNNALELFPPVTKQYFNQSNVSRPDLLAKMKNIWKPDMLNIRFSFDPSVPKIERLENGDLKVSFPLDVNIERDDAKKESYENSLITAEITPKGKINYITSKKISGY